MLKKAGENKFLMSIMSKSVSKTVRVDDMFDDFINEKVPPYLRAINETKEQLNKNKKNDIEQKVEVAKCQVNLQKLMLILRLRIV